MSKLESQEDTSGKNFVFPDVEKEIAEIKRVAEKYDPQNPEEFVREFIKKARQGTLQVLDDQTWGELDNTDSQEVLLGDWQRVSEAGEAYDRDWQKLKRPLESGEFVDAPIVVKLGNILHLVSGNTRLMAAKALGIRPYVLIANMSE